MYNDKIVTHTKKKTQTGKNSHFEGSYRDQLNLFFSLSSLSLSLLAKDNKLNNTDVENVILISLNKQHFLNAALCVFYRESVGKLN